MAIGRLAFFTNSIFTDFSVSDVRQIPASSGVTVTVYKGGATATAADTIAPGASGSITIGERGFLRDGDTIFIGTDNTIVALIDTHTGETQLNVTASAGNSGDLVVAIGDRVTATNAKPSLFRDPGGASALASVVVDSRGFYSFFADAEQVDVLEAIGTSLAKRVMPGLVGNRHMSHQSDGAALVAHVLDTDEAWTTGKLFGLYNDGVLKFSVDADSVNNGQTSMTLDTLTINTGTTLPAGDIISADIAALAVTADKLALEAMADAQVDDDASDFAVPSSYGDIPNVFIDVTPEATSSKILLIATIPWSNGATGSNNLLGRIIDDDIPTVIQESGHHTTDAAEQFGMCLIGLVAGFSGTRRYKIQVRSTSAAASDITNSSDRKARIIAVEFKSQA